MQALSTSTVSASVRLELSGCRCCKPRFSSRHIPSPIPLLHPRWPFRCAATTKHGTCLPMASFVAYSNAAKVLPVFSLRLVFADLTTSAFEATPSSAMLRIFSQPIELPSKISVLTCQASVAHSLLNWPFGSCTIVDLPTDLAADTFALADNPQKGLCSIHLPVSFKLAEHYRQATRQSDNGGCPLPEITLLANMCSNTFTVNHPCVQ